MNRRLLVVLELAVVVAAALALHARTFVDPDLGWALDAGARILDGDGVPVVNDRAFIDLGHPVVLHGWALDAFFALLQRSFGGAGIALARVLFVVVDAAAVFFAISRATRSPLLRVALSLGAVAVAPALFLIVRAQLASFALLALVTAALVDAALTARRRALLWATVPLFALWPDLHGGFPAGLGVVVAYCAGVLVEELVKRRRHETVRPWGTLALDVVGLPLACFLATLATPYGIGLWSMVRSTTDANFAELLVEWFPVWNPIALEVAGPTWAALAAGVVVALVLLPRNDVKLRFVVIAIALLTATAVRHTRVCPAVLAPIIAVALARFVDARASALDPRRALVALGVAFVVGAGALAWQASALFALQPRGIGAAPAATTAFLVDNGLHGNVWTTQETGGLVLWACRSCNVSIDGRAQVAYEPAWFAHVLRHQVPDKALLVEKKTDYAFVQAHQEILDALAPEFFALYCDGELCVLSSHADDRGRQYRFPPEHLDDGVLFSRPGRPAPIDSR